MLDVCFRSGNRPIEQINHLVRRSFYYSCITHLYLLCLRLHQTCYPLLVLYLYHTILLIPQSYCNVALFSQNVPGGDIVRTPESNKIPSPSKTFLTITVARSSNILNQLDRSCHVSGISADLNSATSYRSAFKRDIEDNVILLVVV